MEMVLVLELVWCLLMCTAYGALNSGICFPCKCEDLPSQLTVNCSSRGLVHLPSGLPSNLTKLILHNNYMYNIDKRYFANFPNITELDLSYNVQIGLDNVSESFYGLRCSNISVINIASIVPKFSFVNCVILKSDFFKYLKNTPLQIIYLDKNWIHLIEPGTFENAPTLLEFFSMSKSRLIFAPQLVIEWRFFRNLRRFRLNGRNSDIFYRQSTVRKQRSANLTALGNLTLYLPPKLEELDLESSAIITSIPKVNVAKNNLKKLRLKKNIIQPILGPVHGLDKLEELDISDNNCDTFPSNISLVIPLPNLRKLYMKGNNVGNNLGNWFDNYQNLTVLDMSYNKISILPETVFDKLLLLEELHLRGNIIYTISVDLRNLLNLRLLDISENKISVLTETMTNQLDSVKEATNLTLDLTGNPIRCSCEDPNLRFIRWIARTNVNIKPKSTLSCFIGGEIKKDIVQYIKELEKKCESPTKYYGLAMGASIAITECMSFIIMGLIYRYRYKLAFIYFVGRRRYRHQAANDEDYNMLMEFDAYIAYADEDRQFAVHTFREKLELGYQLNLCFRDRDFLPGEVIASCIVSAIQRSRRVIMVLSPEFLKSSWRIYDFEMAHCESIERARDMIVLVKYKDFPLKDVPEEMLRMLHSQTYLKFPETEEDQETFWETMKERISEI